MSNVLVVDDYLINQQLYSHILTTGGYQAFLADNGVTALEVLEKEDIALMISDLEMPEMDGLDLAKHVREHPTLNQIPIIMVTGSGIQNDENLAKSTGIDYFLRKPVSTRELLEAVHLLFPT